MNTIPTPLRRKSPRQQGGYTLLEMLIAISLMSLVFLGGMDLIISASRTTVRTQGQMYATADAANCIQRIIAQVREAQKFTAAHQQRGQHGGRPVDFALTNTTLGQFSTTALNGNTVNTAIADLYAARPDTGFNMVTKPA